MGSSQGIFLLGILLFFVLTMYFTMRRQRMVMNQAAELQTSLKIGDLVLTSVGLIGSIVSIADSYVELELSTGITVKWSKIALKEIVE